MRSIEIRFYDSDITPWESERRQISAKLLSLSLKNGRGQGNIQVDSRQTEKYAWQLTEDSRDTGTFKGQDQHLLTLITPTHYLNMTRPFNINTEQGNDQNSNTQAL